MTGTFVAVFSSLLILTVMCTQGGYVFNSCLKRIFCTLIVVSCQKSMSDALICMNITVTVTAISIHAGLCYVGKPN